MGTNTHVPRAGIMAHTHETWNRPEVSRNSHTREDQSMAMVLIEEVLMGLEDVKASLEQAMTTLEALTEDLHAEVGNNLKGRLTRELLSPLQSGLVVLETLLDDVAAMS